MKIKSLFLCLFATFGLVACSANASGTSSNTGSSVPTYQGMTVTRSGAPLRQRKNKEGDNGNHYGHDKHDDDIEEDIEEIVDIDVQADEEVKYYVQPNETFIIQVHISNPNEYEIQSFTLNGKKYANYMFKDGSTMELLLLETTAPSTSGYVDYTIDAIKYIDGTTIKDVDMSKGDKSIKAGISYTQAPVADITSYDVGTTYIELGVDVSDPNNLIGTNPLTMYLSDGESIVDSRDLRLGENRVRFDDLTMSTTYQYGVVTLYDFVDGRDEHEEWILKNTFTTLGAFTIDNVSATKTAIYFDVERTGEVGVIDSISLYDATTRELVLEGDSSTRSFEGLLSNHTYNLYVDFSYLIGGETLTDWVGEESITTVAKIAPTVSFSSVSADKTSVSYGVDLEDVDGIIGSIKAELLKNGIAVVDNGSSLNGTFAGLLSNCDYAVRVSYAYDLNDGKGPVSNSIEQDVKTVAKAIPSVSFAFAYADKTSVTYSVEANDPDGVISGTTVELLKNGEAVQDNGSTLNGSFSGLLSNCAYSVRVSYVYDLNDGRGPILESIAQDVMTQAKIAPTLSFSSATADKTSVSYNVGATDSDGILNVTKVELLKNGETVQENGTSLSGTFSGLLSNNAYSVRVSYTYDLNDGRGPIPGALTETVKTAAKKAPTLSISSTSTDKTSVYYNVDSSDVDGILNVTKVELLKNGETVQENGTSLNGTFSELLSNNAYSIRVSYTYDLNDGRGPISDSIIEDVRTVAKIAPSISFSSISADKTFVYYNVDVSDEDDILSVSKVELLKNGETVQDNGSSLSGTFFGLLSNCAYSVRVSYTYDLNDGRGPISDSIIEDVRTIAKIAPTLSFSSATADKTSISYGVVMEDADGVLKTTNVELLRNGETVQEKGSSLNGTFSGLLSNCAYSVRVSYAYDLNDGRGSISDFIVAELKTTAKAIPTFLFSSVSSDKTSISYDAAMEDPDGVLTSTKVELLRNGETLQEDGSSLSGIFSELLSNNLYSVRVSYTYDLNDGRGPITDSIVEDVRTVAKTAPTLSFSSLTADKTSISYGVDVSDVDGVINVTKVELLRNGAIVQDNGYPLHGTFSGLLSNCAYSVRVSYTYDLNDGKGPITDFIVSEISTEGKTIPSVVISDDEVTDTTIRSSLTLLDEDSVGFIDSVQLYQGEELIATNSSKEISFGDLDYYADYTVVVTYKYDLNDGRGVQTATFSKDYKTSPHLELNSCSIVNTSAISEGDTIYMQVSLDNPQGALPTSVVINGEEYNCTGSTTAKRIFVEVVNNGQFEGGDTVLTIERINMSLDGKQYLIIPAENNYDGVFINGAIAVQGLCLLDAEGKEKELPYFYEREDVRFALKLSNKTGYSVDSVIIDGVTYDSLTKISDDCWVIEGLPFDNNYRQFSVASIHYFNSALEKELTTDNRAAFYKVQNETPISVTSKEQLKRMSEGSYCYSLDCDLDLSGEEWVGYGFTGVLLGNSHSIKNMSYVGTKTDVSFDYGLFSYVGYGIIADLNIESSTVIIDVKTSDGQKYGCRCGALSAVAEYSYIVNCTVDSDSVLNITGEGMSDDVSNIGRNGIGGLIGYATGYCVIIHCENYSDIYSTCGLVGGLSGVFSTCRVMCCANYGSVTGDLYVGGMVGFMWRYALIDCNNYGTITSFNQHNFDVEGICAVANEGDTSITNCNNYGSVIHP